MARDNVAYRQDQRDENATQVEASHRWLLKAARRLVESLEQDSPRPSDVAAHVQNVTRHAESYGRAKAVEDALQEPYQRR